MLQADSKSMKDTELLHLVFKKMVLRYASPWPSVRTKHCRNALM